LHTANSSSTRKTCGDCHARDGVGHPLPRSSSATDITAHFSVEIFALRREVAGKGQPERIDLPLSSRQVALAPGENVTVDVLVNQVHAGHAIPQFAADKNPMWLSLNVSDQSGNTVLESGSTRKGLPPADAHRYQSIVLDRNGIVVKHHCAQDTVA